MATITEEPIKCDGGEFGFYNSKNDYCVKICGYRYTCAHKSYLEEFPTRILVNELSRREGVTEIICLDPDHRFDIDVRGPDGKPMEKGICGMENTGPARILVVID